MCIIGPAMNANIINIYTHSVAHCHLFRSAKEAMRAENFTAVAAAAAKVAELATAV